MFADFLPHGYCMRWQPGLLGTHVAADALIALAYFCIPALLWSFVRKRRDLQFNWIFGAFALFILACGITHVMDIVTLWVPLYLLSAFFKAMTAIVSAVTVVALYRLMPDILHFSTPRQMQNAWNTLKDQALILDLANDSVMIRDHQSRITYWNQGAQRLYGWSKEEVLGQVTHELFSTQFPEPVEDIQAQLTSHGHWKGELLHRRKDGRLITVASNWTLQKNGTNGSGSVLEINTDITSRKRAEDLLNTAMRRLSLATDALQAGVWDWDIRTNAIVWDDRMCEIYGVPGNTEINYQFWRDAVVPDDLAALEVTLQGVIDLKSQASMVFRITLPNGSLRYIQAAEGAVMDDAGRVVRVIGINIDTTDRKFNEDLERQVAERTAQLNAVNKELEEFAYVASHDLKAPLRVIDNASKWLEEDLAQHLTGEIRANLTLMRSRIKRMDRLLDDLLQYAGIGKATDDRYGEAVNGKSLMHDVLALVCTPDFTIKVHPAFSNIEVCRMPLQHILMNLVSNAIKHHHKKTGCIEVNVEDNGDHYTFAVKDDGPGIPEQFHDQIFKMFQTLRPRDQVEGSGMGLAMVRKNIEVFGGTLQLESDEGRGSTFRFTWPKRQQHVTREAA